MILDKSTPIVIYGCGYLGVLLLKTLESLGLSVECGIDKRGDELESFCGKPAYSLNSATAIEDRDEKLLVVAVKNVFEHESIAKMLNGLGFKYILYKPGKVLEGKPDDYSSSISDVYETLLLLSRPKDQRGGVESLRALTFRHTDRMAECMRIIIRSSGTTKSLRTYRRR